MLRYMSILLATVGLAFSVSACAETDHARFAVDTHYRLLDKPVAVDDPTKIEVREFFFYGCPHCYDTEPLVQEWTKSKPADVDLVLNPVLFINGAEPLARAFYVAQRSEEHTSELQSRPHLVCRLLLEKKKKNIVPDSVVT